MALSLMSFDITRIRAVHCCCVFPADDSQYNFTVDQLQYVGAEFPDFHSDSNDTQTDDIQIGFVINFGAALNILRKCDLFEQ